MVRILNFVCVVITAFACLALNHVSDQTRVAEAQLRRTKVEIAKSANDLKLLEADWERAANPSHIQALAAAHLGLADTATVQVASLELLPRRGDVSGAGAAEVTAASAAIPAAGLHLHLAAARAGD